MEHWELADACLGFFCLFSLEYNCLTRLCHFLLHDKNESVMCKYTSPTSVHLGLRAPTFGFESPYLRPGLPLPLRWGLVYTKVSGGCKLL